LMVVPLLRGRNQDGSVSPASPLPGRPRFVCKARPTTVTDNRASVAGCRIDPKISLE
jgi:hypothetical protein